MQPRKLLARADPVIETERAPAGGEVEQLDQHSGTEPPGSCDPFGVEPVEVADQIVVAGDLAIGDMSRRSRPKEIRRRLVSSRCAAMSFTDQRAHAVGRRQSAGSRPRSRVISS